MLNKNRIIERLDKQEMELTRIYWDIHSERGWSEIAERLDTIVDKVYKLKKKIEEERR